MAYWMVRICILQMASVWYGAPQWRERRRCKCRKAKGKDKEFEQETHKLRDIAWMPRRILERVNEDLHGGLVNREVLIAFRNIQQSLLYRTEGEKAMTLFEELIRTNKLNMEEHSTQTLNT